MSQSMRRSVRWPKAPHAPGNALRRMAGNLRAAGIQFQFSRADIRGRRVVSLVCASELGKRSSVAVSGGQTGDLSADSPHLFKVSQEFLSQKHAGGLLTVTDSN
jgi:hypothetical protein